MKAAFLALFLGVLSACGGSQPEQRAQVAVQPGDWGPHIREASQRFRVPEEWIRAVMEIESGGRTHMRGRPITSHAGAMGLMQVMPATYQELRRAHGLGPDPHYPRDNILAGTAYIRQMYDQYGFPGFLGAYNAGPGRYGDFVNRGRTLPRETRNYMARIEPMIAHLPHPDRYDYATRGRGQIAAAPAAPSSPTPAAAATRASAAPAVVRAAQAAPAQQSAPVQAAATPRPAAPQSDSRPYWAASTTTAGVPTVTASQSTSPTAPRPATQPATQNLAYRPASADGRVLVASFESPAASGGGANGPASSGNDDIIARWASAGNAPVSQPANGAANTASLQRVAGPDWGVQVGAFRTEEQGLQALQDAARTVPGLGAALEQVTAVTTGDGSALYRARLIGLSPDQAADACIVLNRTGAACMLVTPG